ncbi:hypothetical protein RHO13_01740 [Orbus wheelerorum]|uniref:hypothetical protein n=1 Tax=Orbus wheelerorum TaxID=3074111 RepID=UPI00370D7825
MWTFHQYQSMLSMPGFTLGESDVGIMYANTMIGGDKSLSNLTASAQVAGGAVSLYLAAAIGATGIGTPLAGTIGFIGLDNLQAGTRSLLSQDTTTTYGAQFLEWAGVPKSYGELVYGLFDISVITKAGYALKATNQVYNVVKVKPIANAKPQQLIKADEVSISVENITKNQQHVVELKGFKLDELTPKKISDLSLDELKNSLPDGWTFFENNGRVHIKDIDKNFRIRIDPPDNVTHYEHIHIFDMNKNPLDINGKIVPYNSLDGHIPWSNK